MMPAMSPADDHPLRYPLVNELHARPSPRLTAPCTVAFLAFKEPQDAANRDRAADFDHLADLVARHGGPRPDPEASHYAGQLGRHELRWESHTEFVTYAAFAPGRPGRPFDPHVASVFPADWQERAPGKRIAAVLIHVEPLPEESAQALARMEEWFVADSLTAAWILEEAALIAGDFRIDTAGWMRFAVFIRDGEGPGRLGRIVQRVLELETYRAMSMLGLGRCRSLTARLNALEPRLSAVVGAMSDDELPAEHLLDELMAISAELETAATQHSFRFGATAAYQAIVMDRVALLRESRLSGRQMLTEFMSRRYLPAMRTVKSAEARLKAMLERATRAGELLRTRVDVQRSAQNQALLASMDRRADLQLRLQHTVEGLSVVAISYYALGLLVYALSPLAAHGAIEKTTLTAILVPVVVIGVWLALRRIKARLHDDHPPGPITGHEADRREL